MIPLNITTVFLLASLTAVATGVGALPLHFVDGVRPSLIGLANALAAGLMLAASLGLIIEGSAFGVGSLLLGMVFGGAFVYGTHAWLERRPDFTLGALSGLDARKVLMIMAVMTVHSFTEGVGVGVSFAGGDALGLFITGAIAFHNVPEGLAIALVLVPRGSSVRAAVGWSIFSSLPQPLMAVPAFLFVSHFATLLPFGFGFAAGAMIWMTASELIPEAIEKTPKWAVGLTILISLAAGALLQAALSV